jgi:hypothetical protein
MATQKVLVSDPTTNLPQELTPNITSAGAADAGKIPALNASGVLDSTLLPPGIGSASQVFPTSEALAAGALVNIFDSTGTPTARNANATDATKPGQGFVLAATTSPANATVYFPGQLVSGVSGLTTGAAVYLSAAISGAVTPTAPSTAGNLIQNVGSALSPTSFVFAPLLPIIKG